jgi:hypothetical protein
MNCLSRIIATSSMTLLLGAFSVSAAPHNMARSSDIKVKGPTVNCGKTKASAPNVGVSVPNVSRLVPNVGKILRKGVGVPAPDTQAPNVSTPKVRASAPTQSCAKSHRSS